MKNLFFILGFICLSAPAFAQFSIGLSGGANVSFPKWYLKEPLDFDLNYESQLGWRAAIMGQYQFSPLFALRAEVASQMKARKNYSTALPEGLKYSFKDKFHDWEGSLLLQISPLKKLQHAYLLAGCTAGQYVRATSTVSGAVFAQDQDETRSIDLKNEAINQNILALDFGLGYKIPVGAANLLNIEARYQYGVNNFATYEQVDAALNALVFNIGFSHLF